MKRGETMVRRKWLPPAAAPGWPACRPDSSRSSIDCGCSSASRSRIAADRSIRSRRSRPRASRLRGTRGVASRRFLLYLDVAGEKQRLTDDECEHQACNPVKLEAHPIVARQHVYGGQIDSTHGREKYDPGSV